MNGTEEVCANLLAYLHDAVPVQLAPLAAAHPTVGLVNPATWYTPARPVGQIDLWPSLMVAAGPAGPMRDVETTEDGKFTYTLRYHPSVFVYARGNSYEETNSRRNLLADAVWFALLADEVLTRRGEWELVPGGMTKVPSTIQLDKDSRSIAGCRIDLAVDVFETAPLAQPPQYADFGDADTIFVETSELAWEPA